MNSTRNAETVEQAINDFLNRRNLSQKEFPWELKESKFGGLGVFASKDIEIGEEIFRDFPVIIGPRTIIENSIFCVACYNQKNLHPCSHCGLPVCSMKCTENHSRECEFINKRRESPITVVDEQLFKISTPLRVFLLESEDRNLVSLLKRHRGADHGFEIDKLKEVGLKLQKWEEEYLRLVCCVMDANAFEVVLDNGVNLRGLYPLGSLVNHSCVPNTMHIFDKNRLMIVRACVRIEKGEELFHSYARLIWSTPARIYHLYRTKHFLCRCARCSDPREFGTYMSAFLCKICKGNVISKNSLNLRSDWICEDCHTEVKRIDIANLFSTLGSVLRSFDGDNLDVMLKFLNEKLPKLVPPNNEIAVEVKYKILWSIGYQPKFEWKDIDDTLLELKEVICLDLLRLVDMLGLGECNLKGLILFEHYQCLREKCRRSALAATNGFNMDTEQKMADILKQAAKILKNDVSAPEEIKSINETHGKHDH